MASQPTDVRLAYPAASALQLHLSLGPCRARIGAGGQEPWVSGTYHDPAGLLPLEGVLGPLDQRLGDGGGRRLEGVSDAIALGDPTDGNGQIVR